MKEKQSRFFFIKRPSVVYFHLEIHDNPAYKLDPTQNMPHVGQSSPWRGPWFSSYQSDLGSSKMPPKKVWKYGSNKN